MEATLREFNRRMAMTLMGPQQVQPPTPALQPKQKQLKPAVRPKSQRQNATTHSGDKRRREDTAAEEEDKSHHILMPNLGKAKMLCRLCSKRGVKTRSHLKTRSRYGCMQCRLGFHVECFAVFHNPDKFTTNPSDSVQDALDAISNNSSSRPRTRRRENHSIMSFDQLTLPSLIMDEDSSDTQEV